MEKKKFKMGLVPKLILAIILGILCNFLVCIAVWISFAAKTVGAKFAGLFMPIMLFVGCGFEHSVANMYYVPAGT